MEGNMENTFADFQAGVLLDGRYETVSPLNHGSFGVVTLALDTVTGDMVAIKCSNKAIGSPSEVAFHKLIGSHPNIVNLLHSFETEEQLFLVLEYCPNGDLYEAIRAGRGPLEIEHVRDFMLQLVSAVEHMHSKGVYHRDIKPENILLSADGQIKLGDFGLATTETFSDEEKVGSDRYMSPEQYDKARGGDGGYSPELADIWAIGVCLLNILFAKNPFLKPSEEDMLFADYMLDRQSLFDIFPTLSQDAYEVLTHSLAIDPNQRSLEAMRDAIERVFMWTTDNESLDDFCTKEAEPKAVVGTREPLRTPSIVAAPTVDSFPWTEALRNSPVIGRRQLSIIPDTESFGYSEDMFSDFDDNWSPDRASFAPQSFDSDFNSLKLRMPLHRLDQLNTKLDAPKDLALHSPYLAADESFVSKSWDDWVLEDEEERSLQLEHVPTAKRLPCTLGMRFQDTADDNISLSDSISEKCHIDDAEDDVEWVTGGHWEDLVN